MQHGQKHRALERKLKPSPPAQVKQHLPDTTVAPQALEDQRRTDSLRAGGQTLAVGVCPEHGVLLGEPPERGEQPIQFATGAQLIESP
jgi:hypothetical protein